MREFYRSATRALPRRLPWRVEAAPWWPWARPVPPIAVPRSRPPPADHVRAAAVVHDGLAAGAAGAVVSGAPSTLHALLTGRDPLAASVAAGSLVLPHESRTPALLLVAVPVHVALSLGWAVLLAAVLPRRHTVAVATAAGLAIAALDLGLVGRRFPRIRELAPLPQVADHLAFGAVAGMVLRRRRAGRPDRAGPPGAGRARC